ASAGISAVKFVAKIASDLAKPNGQREIPEDQTRAALAPLPVSRLWGVGLKAEEQLRALGLNTIGDIAAKSPEWIDRRLGSHGRWLYDLSQGMDDREVKPDPDAKSIGAEDTFEEDQQGEEALKVHLHAQALRVGRRLRRSQMKTRVVQLKLKDSFFQLTTRRMTLEAPTDDGQVLYRAAVELLGRADMTKHYRLTGVSAQDLKEPPPQLSLFTPPPARADKLNAVLDRIAGRFGTNAVITADLAAVEQPDDEQENEARRKVGAARFDKSK
ncbi:MAG: DinB/UmuC family translesion DNA polymerase, partial [Myxococcaceae bacterium]